MFLRTENVILLDRLGKKHHSKECHFVCNQCNSKFTKRSPKKKFIEQPYHFCDKKCSNDACKRGGVIDLNKRANCIQKYGAEHHLQNAKIQQKRLATCEKLFGGRAPMSSQHVQEKTAKTNEERYGGHFSRNPEIKQKKRDTCMKKYGVDSFSKTEEFKEKIDWRDLTRKGFETRKKMGKSKISKIEASFGEFLKNHFECVENQVEVNSWWMDFYVPSIKTYVQFDGDYWHGLDALLEDLLKSDKPQHRVIAGTKMRDAQREEWFSAKGLKLVRIRESAFKKKQYDQILMLIKGNDHGLQTI